VLCSDASSSTVGTTEDDRTWDVSSRHVVGLASRVNDLVDSLHGKVEGHEFASLLCQFCVSGCDLVPKNDAYTGRKPARAAPTARPAKPISVIGVSTTRFSPNLSNKPFVTYETKQKKLNAS
jgi:hypothetical protein